MDLRTILRSYEHVVTKNGGMNKTYFSGGDGHYGRQNECCNEEISKVSVSFEEANRFGSVVRGVIIWGWWVGGGAGEKSRILLLAIPGACVQTTFTLFLFFI